MKRYRYVRDLNKNPIAVVACVDGMVGWSCCCAKDEFNKQRGRHIAEERAIMGTPLKIPDYRVYIDYRGNERRLVDSVSEIMSSMKEKAEKFLSQPTVYLPQGK